MWADSVESVAALGELRSLVQAANSIDALVSAAVCKATSLAKRASVSIAQALRRGRASRPGSKFRVALSGKSKVLLRSRPRLRALAISSSIRLT